MAIKTYFGRWQLAAMSVVILATNLARAQASQASDPSASGPNDAPSLSTTVAPGVAPTTLRWHDTYLYWDNAISARTVGVGQSFQSSDPLYEMTIGLRPRYYFIDDRQMTLSLRADLGVVTERTNSDSTTERGEWSATDTELYGAFGYKLRDSPNDLTEVSLRLPWVTLPTSKVSYESGKVLGVGVRAGLRENIALEGNSANFFPSLDLLAKAEYGYLFTRAEEPTNSGLERIRLDPDGRSVISDQLGGASFARHAAVFGGAALLHVHRDVLWTTALEIREAWKYPVDHSVQVCGVVLTGCTEATGVQNPQARSVLTFFQTEFWVTLSETLGVSFGYANLTTQLGPDGRRRGLFYSPDARFYATLNVGLDHLYGTLSHRPRQSAAGTSEHIP